MRQSAWPPGRRQLQTASPGYFSSTEFLDLTHPLNCSWKEMVCGNRCRRQCCDLTGCGWEMQGAFAAGWSLPCCASVTLCLPLLLLCWGRSFSPSRGHVLTLLFGEDSPSPLQLGAQCDCVSRRRHQSASWGGLKNLKSAPILLLSILEFQLPFSYLEGM